MKAQRDDCKSVEPCRRIPVASPGCVLSLDQLSFNPDSSPMRVSLPWPTEMRGMAKRGLQEIFPPIFLLETRKYAGRPLTAGLLVSVPMEKTKIHR